MPSQSEVKWSQLKVGIIVIVSAAMLVTLLFLITSSSGLGLFSHKLTVTSYFENAAGIKDGAAVNLQGVTIGTVKAVNVVDDPSRKLTPIQVVMRIDGKYQKDLRKDTKSALSTVGVLGDTVVDLNSQVATGPELQDGDEIKTLESPNLQDVVKASQGTIESLNVILAKMDRIVDTISQGKGSVGGLIYDDTLYRRASDTVDELHKLEVNLNNGKGSVGKLLKDESMYNHLNSTTAKLDKIASDLDAGKGSAGKLLKDDSLYNNLNATLVHANNIMAQADQGKGALGLLTKDQVFADKLNSTVTRLDSIMSGIDKGEGTAGLLVKDPALYHNLDKLAVDSQSLVNTIRSDPKKYLTIHFKIF
ncbi:ABC-type transport system involved in resistance to organic solvents, periplasmic component [Terriglobus roseus DSM 18391]|uniref:ABC-type transport system involved in resistance to organic solvents, periplasmic component n=1 Tax=Terriglobus roseus (strain DSM 18391 / NRRL B-41598 / KBS 63) TaxID=926566 RepID=I3ZDA3_TERRK|nr:MlaD family protein [Terriglobus roseus]AFL87221.1 ABC-type transport system involved in resistance to organic solvents, periplasmic component [Terriglobus roseus DSM 18391]